jgi:hypothetical protein
MQYIKIDTRPGLYTSILETMFTVGLSICRIREGLLIGLYQTWYSASIAADTMIAFAMVILVRCLRVPAKTNDLII